MPSTAVWLRDAEVRFRWALSLALLIVAGELVAVSLWLAVSFLSPTKSIATPVAHYNVGASSKFAFDKPVYFAKGDFWLVRRPGLAQADPDRFLALYNEDPARDVGLPCSTPWRADFRYQDPRTNLTSTGWFRSGCRGQTYDLDGHCVSGPCLRMMDHYPVTVTNGSVVVNIGEGALIKTERRR